MTNFLNFTLFCCKPQCRLNNEFLHCWIDAVIKTHCRMITALEDKARMSCWLQPSCDDSHLLSSSESSAFSIFPVLKWMQVWAVELPTCMFRMRSSAAVHARNARAGSPCLFSVWSHVRPFGCAAALLWQRFYLTDTSCGHTGVCPNPATARYSPQLLIYWHNNMDSLCQHIL